MSALGEFFRWWGAELRGLAPGAGRHDRRRFDALTVVLAEDVVTFERRSHRRDTAQVLAELPRDAVDAGLPQPQADLLRRRVSSRRTALEVRVPKSRSLARQVVLPAVAEENLREVVGFELERLTPFKPADVVFDVEVVERDPQRRQITVELRVVPLRVVDEGQALVPPDLLAIDRESPTVRIDADEATIGFAPMLARRRASPALNMFLVVLNLALLGAVLGIPLYEQHRQLDELEGNLTQARGAAAEANAVQDELDAVERRIAKLLGTKSERATAVEIIEDIARRLPDSTWIFRFELKGSTVQISGTSDAASSLIEAIEASDLLSGTRFASPVTREPGTGRERFHISSTLVVPAVRTLSQHIPRAPKAPNAKVGGRANAVDVGGARRAPVSG